MYISRRVDIIGPPVWKSTISPCLSKSKLASLRLWQSECQWHTLSPLHHHMLTPPRYLTTLSHTQNPSDVERDKDREGNEWAFSLSNSLASVTWHATPYYRHLQIHIHFMKWDEDKYEWLGELVLITFWSNIYLFKQVTSYSTSLHQHWQQWGDVWRTCRLWEVFSLNLMRTLIVHDG